MPKNLILVHLESISNTIFWQYREELKTLWGLMHQSFVFNRFYSSATSTEMSLNYIRTGTSTVFDRCSVFQQSKNVFDPAFPDSLVKNLYFDLFFAGYGRKGGKYAISEAFDCKEVRSTENSICGPSQDEIMLHVRTALANAKAEGNPFWFHFIMYITHITANDRVKDSAKTFSDRFRLAYLRLDEAIAKFMRMLLEFKLLENSIIVFYGDHGDELWSHGLNGGWCHVGTPYASQCWTPLFIYEHGVPPGSTDQLASAIDLRKTLIKRLVPDYDPAGVQLDNGWINKFGKPIFTQVPPFFPQKGSLPPFGDSLFDGIDLASQTRELAFSQNLFALQLEFNDQAKALTKGYAVTDGIYRLTVSSGGKDARDGGLELFYDNIDPTNSRSLLDFFKLDHNGDIREFYPPPEAVNREFELVFNPEAVTHLKQTYQHLKKSLYEYVREKERLAMAQPKSAKPGENGHIMPESAFKHARKKPYKD